MAVGGGARRVVPAAEQGGVRIATVMTAKLSCDRRVVDEAIAGQYLQAFKHYLQKPELMLL
jgi:pyruvate/2-oxoglutarate dehydrogenase complex dihydrolipoamide acyltransferase (E2) component